MFHSNTERLIDYWRERKVDRLSPQRSAINPADLTDLLTQMFILGRTAPGQYPFRLAGGLPSDLHQRDLRKIDFVSLWTRADQPRLRTILEDGRRAGEPVVLVAEAITDRDATARIELVLAPLRAETLPPDRCLGLYQPLSPLSPLQRRPIRELTLIQSGAADPRPAFPRLVALDGQLVG